MKGIGPVAIALVVAFFLVGLVGLIGHTMFGATVERSISAQETEVIRAVNKLEMVKIGLPYALEYSFQQAVYDVSKNGGYFFIQPGVPTYNSLPTWRKYDKTYQPDYITNTIQTTLNNLNKYASQVKTLNIPHYTGVDILCGGGILYQYEFNPPETCYYSKLTLRGERIGDIAYSDECGPYGLCGLMRGGCSFSFPACFGKKSDTVQYNVGWCYDEYYLSGDSESYKVTAAEVNNRAYIWASGEPYSDVSWAIECCLPGTGTEGCNSDSTEGQRFHANNVFSLANKDKIDKYGASEEDVVKKFNLAWCGNKDRNCLLCHTDVNDVSKTKWYVCEGSPVPEGHGVVVVKAGERIGSFECGYDGQWTQPTNIFCPVSTLTIRAVSNGLISVESELYKAYENPNASQVVQSNLFNMFRIAREKFIDEDTIKNTIINVISTNRFTCNSDNSTVRSRVSSAITSSFSDGDVYVQIQPMDVLIKPNCNSTVAVAVEVAITDKLPYLVYDGTTSYRNPQLRFYVITSNDYSFRPI